MPGGFFNRVYDVVFLENYYDSIDVKNSLEEMVLAHVQHISQKNSVQVIRLILRDTVEEENYENLLPQNEDREGEKYESLLPQNEDRKFEKYVTKHLVSTTKDRSP